MKKVMFAAAVAAGLVAFGDSSIESQNIVGYNTIPSISQGQYVALGVQFENCNGGAIPVKDLIQVGSIQGSAAMGVADQIWRWNTASAAWTKYYYYSSRGVTRWVVSTDTTKETTDTVPAGETVFFLRMGNAATSLTLSGAVKVMEGASSVTVTQGQLAFMANPWPSPVSIASFNSNYATGSTPQGSAAMGVADQIWRWNTATASWTKYYYYSSRGVTRWVESTDTTKETTDTIPAGEGFFFQRMGNAAATISIAAPAAN